jgi:predicted nuclease with TOPRIM domain
MLKCNSCRKDFDDSHFMSNKGLQTLNCLSCRQRYNKSKEKHVEKQANSTKLWKENNSEYISFMNSLYNKTKDMPKDERKLLIEKLKKENFRWFQMVL